MKQFFAKEISSSEKNRVGPIGSEDNKESFLIRRHRKESEAKLDSAIRKQKGVTLIELLVVVAILSILGGITGLFLLKYLPEYHLQSAANNLSQDLKFAQINALKNYETYSVIFSAGTDQTYKIQYNAGNDIKTVDIKNYGSNIRFNSIPTEAIKFSSEGIRSDNGNGIIKFINNAGSIITTEVYRTGAVRVE